MGIIPFLTGFQERILLKPFFVLFCFMRKLFRKLRRGEKKSNDYVMLGKFLINLIHSKGEQHDLKR